MMEKQRRWGRWCNINDRFSAVVWLLDTLESK
jgi:hypothetical protein